MIIDQRLTMVGERQRHHSPPCQEALDLAQHNPIRQFRIRAGSSENDWLVSVGTVQGFEPGWRMEHGGPWVPRNELSPTRISSRINLISTHTTGGLGRKTDRTLALCSALRHSATSCGTASARRWHADQKYPDNRANAPIT